MGIKGPWFMKILGELILQKEIRPSRPGELHAQNHEVGMESPGIRQSAGRESVQEADRQRAWKQPAQIMIRKDSAHIQTINSGNVQREGIEIWTRGLRVFSC